MTPRIGPIGGVGRRQLFERLPARALLAAAGVGLATLSAHIPAGAAQDAEPASASAEAPPDNGAPGNGAPEPPSSGAEAGDGASAPASESAPEPPPAPGARLTSIGLDVPAAWTPRPVDPFTMPLPLAPVSGGLYGFDPAVGASAPTLEELLRANPGGAPLTADAERRLGAADWLTAVPTPSRALGGPAPLLRAWLLDEYGFDYADQAVEVAAGGVAAETLSLAVALAPPGPGASDLAAEPRTQSVNEIKLFADFAGEQPYFGPEPGEPGLLAEELLEVEALLLPVEGGYIAARAGLPGMERIRLGDLPALSAGGAVFYTSAVNAYGFAIAERFQREGLLGVRVGIDRPLWRDTGELRYFIPIARVGAVRLVERDPDGEGQVTEELGPGGLAEAESRFLRRSPVGAGDLVDRAAIDGYIHRLNRHPGRRMDVALTPAAGGEAVDFDYVLTRGDQLSIYAQLSNTGTEETTLLRERFGLTHTDLTGADDILQIDYVTGNFDQVHAVFGSYERPFPGLPALRMRVFGSYTEYDASQVGVGGNFTGESYAVGGEAALNVVQSGPFFLDVIGGIRYEDIETTSDDTGIDAREPFLLPNLGLRAERRVDESSFYADAILEWNLPDAAGTDQDTIDELGRINTSDDWTLLRWQVTQLFYLERVFTPAALRRGEGTLAHEMLLSARGLYSFSRRLPPNFGDTLGGFYTIRGYPESFAFGDRTFAVTAEYRLHVPRLLDPSAEPSRLFGREFLWRPPRPLARPDWDFILRGFLDAGWTRQIDREFFELDETLIGAGVGAEINFRDDLIARLDVGFPLESASDGFGDDVDAGDVRLHFSVTLVF